MTVLNQNFCVKHLKKSCDKARKRLQRETQYLLQLSNIENVPTLIADRPDYIVMNCIQDADLSLINQNKDEHEQHSI